MTKQEIIKMYINDLFTYMEKTPERNTKITKLKKEWEEEEGRNKIEEKKTMNLWICPICGSKTNTYRHLYAKVWCPKCGHILRKKGDMSITQ